MGHSFALLLGPNLDGGDAPLRAKRAPRGHPALNGWNWGSGDFLLKFHPWPMNMASREWTLASLQGVKRFPNNDAACLVLIFVY